MTIVAITASLTGCINIKNSKNTSTGRTASIKKAKKVYDYKVVGNKFIGKISQITINHVFQKNVDGKPSIFADISIKNTSKKTTDFAHLLDFDILAYQKSTDGSRLNILNNQAQLIDAYLNDKNAYNQLRNINYALKSRLLPGKTLHTLLERGFTLSNTKNDIEFQLTHLNKSIKIDPKNNEYLVKISDTKSKAINLSDYAQ